VTRELCTWHFPHDWSFPCNIKCLPLRPHYNQKCYISLYRRATLSHTPVNRWLSRATTISQSRTVPFVKSTHDLINFAAMTLPSMMILRQRHVLHGTKRSRILDIIKCSPNIKVSTCTYPSEDPTHDLCG
jgi:hypothetical protein